MHYPLARVRPIASCRTSGTGYLDSCQIRHNHDLAVFAANHRGRLNLDVVILGQLGRLEWATGRPIIYAHQTASMGELRLRLVHHVVYRHKAGEVEPNLLPPQEGGDKYSQVPVARMQAALHVRTGWHLGATYSDTFTSGVGVPGELFTLSGGEVTSGSAGYADDHSFTGSHSTRALKRRIDITANRQTDYANFGHLAESIAQEQFNAKWTSGVHVYQHPSGWRDCFAQRYGDYWIQGH